MASNIYLKFDPEVKGEAGDQGFEGQITLDSINFGMSSAVTALSGGRAAKVQVDNALVTKHADVSSPVLISHLVKGTVFKSAQVSFVKARGTGPPLRYLTYTFGDVIITSWSSSPKQTGDIPHELMNLSFGNFKVEYTEQRETGGEGRTTGVAYDLRTK